MKPPLSVWRFLYVWSKRQLRIKANTLTYAFSFGKKKKDETRSGTHSKRKSGFLLQAFMLGIYAFLAFNMSWQTIAKLNSVIPDSDQKNAKIYVDFSSYHSFQYIEERAKIEKEQSPQKTLPEIRKEILSEKTEIFDADKKGPKVTTGTYLQKINKSLQKSQFSQLAYSKQEIDNIIETFINEGLPKIFEREFKSSQYDVKMTDGKSEEFLKWVGLYFLLCLFALSLIEGIGNKNPLMMAPEDDLENLAVFPIKVWVLFLLPLLQRSFFNVMSLLVVFPPSICFLIVLGHGTFESVLMAIPISLVFCLCTGSLQICYQFLGRYNNRKWLRSMCSYMQLPGYGIFCLVLMGGQLKSLLYHLRGIALENPGSFLPPAMILRFFHEGQLAHLWQPLLLTAAFPVTALFFIHLYSKGGLPNIPLESSKTRSGTLKNSTQPQCALRLVRDKNYFIQTVVFPIMLFSFYLFMFLDKSSGIDGTKALSMLFGAASFILLGSILNIAAHEGPGLWLLFSASKEITDILKKSIHFWLKVVTAFYIIGLVIMFSVGIEDMPILKSIALIFGLPSIAYIAASLSFSAYPPPTGNEPQKPKPAIIYFYMLIASMYAQAVLVGMPGAEFSSPVLFGFLAYALWQDSRKSINYYLDPDYLPPQELTAKNAMVWCICFFWVQSLIYMIIFFITKEVSFSAMTISYGLASMIVAGTAAYWYKKRLLHKIEIDSSKALSDSQLFLMVLACGFIFIGFAWIYLKILRATFPDLPFQSISFDQRIYFCIMVVIMAPLLEEYLFRRLLLVSLLRNLSPKVAIIACAFIFAAVHPITSFPPVFCLGLGASWIYWRSGSIWAAIGLHALYNLGIMILS